MKLNRIDKGEVTVLELRGKIMGGPDAVSLNETLHELVDSGNKKVVIDLNEVNWMNSSGLGILISGLTTVRNSDGVLCLARLTDRIKSLLEITKLTTVFDCYDDIDDAVSGIS